MSAPDILADIEAALVKAVAEARALYAKEGASPQFFDKLARLSAAVDKLTEVSLEDALSLSPWGQDRG